MAHLISFFCALAVVCSTLNSLTSVWLAQSLSYNLTASTRIYRSTYGRYKHPHELVATYIYILLHTLKRDELTSAYITLVISNNDLLVSMPGSDAKCKLEL